MVFRSVFLKSALLAAAVFSGFSALADESKLKELSQLAQKNGQAHFDKIMAAGPLRSSVVGQMEANSGAARDSKTPTKEIKEADDQWIAWYKQHMAHKAGVEKVAPTAPSTATEIEKRDCSKQLASYLKANPDIIEIFAMDASGVTICAAELTSDYDQGDEPKWLKPFLENTSPFVEPPQMDQSTKSYQVKVSFLVNNGTKKIGVLTLGLKPQMK